MREKSQRLQTIWPSKNYYHVEIHRANMLVSKCLIEIGKNLQNMIKAFLTCVVKNIKSFPFCLFSYSELSIRQKKFTKSSVHTSFGSKANHDFCVRSIITFLLESSVRFDGIVIVEFYINRAWKLGSLSAALHYLSLENARRAQRSLLCWRSYSTP